MKTIKLFMLLFSFSLISLTAIAQDTTAVKLDDKAKMQLVKLEEKLQTIEAEEKAKLKKMITELNAQQEQEALYSPEDFEAIKMQNAKRTAENIANRQAIVKNQIDFLKRNGYLEDESAIETKGKDGEDGEDGDKSFVLDLKINQNDDSDERHRLKTQGDLIFAIGFNNAIPENGDLNDSPFKLGGSRFFEIGYIWSTPLDRKNFMRLDYGFSFQFNGLKPKDDLVFVENGDQTELESFQRGGQNINLNKSKFRQDNLIFPVHLHFNTKRGGEDYFTRDGFNFGLGGFLGLNLNNVQKVKYDFNGDSEKEKFKDDYNTNNFLYGLSAYAGFGDMTLYFTYSLNTIFENNPESLNYNNVQLGLRFAF
jgi:hypothetical protein